MAKTRSRQAPTSLRGLSNVVPDRLDLRDRMYMPPVAVIPGQQLNPGFNLPVLHQGETNACTGFALASVVYALQRAAKRPAAECRVSPFMLYSMARRYDEFPGNPEADTGSSARGAMKGWFKYGACAEGLWRESRMPGPAKDTKKDWWLDAVNRPLGAYYRVDPRSVTDMHVALHDVGVLYVTAACHSGWDTGVDVKAKGLWHIPTQRATAADGGHAFVILGYNTDGFIVQNSWGPSWGTGGRAILHYEDWLDNAMDCWVAQLGVVTDLHKEIARASSLRMRGGHVQIAGDSTLRAREITPFIIDMANNGQLSNTGNYFTRDSDIHELVGQHLGTARSTWGLGAREAVDVAIYAHGGLTSEGDAATTASKWIPALYENRIFPIFLMWETDLFSTLKDRLEDVLKGEPRRAGGPLDSAKRWWNERLERLLADPGTMVWGEMKQNGAAISEAGTSGGMKLYEAAQESPHFSDLSKVRLHLIGHSAGAIVHSHIVKRLCQLGWKFETVNFMAPAVRVDEFRECVGPALRKGQVGRVNQFHLSDDIEQTDHTCRPILGYDRSLLYLVSQSFEGGVVTPILGMEKYFARVSDLPNLRAWVAPGAQSKSTTHGGFDDDAATMSSVIALIKGRTI